MDEHIKTDRDGFGFGYSSVTEAGELELDTGISFGILKLRAGESLSELTETETAYLLMDGTAEWTLGDDARTQSRSSLFDEGPCCVHVPAKTLISVHAQTELEIAVSRTPNEKSFPVEWYDSQDVANEDRGAGQVDGTCRRWVRTIFDDSISHPHAELVLGEVVNMPGRWSSYPPHHHAQPEIYHYRFTDSRGFGHAELDDDVLRVRQYDTVKILDEKDHSQCSAPGYGMYYIWVIRHLPGRRYGVPEFTDEHKWTMDAEASFWRPKAEAQV